MYRLLHRLSRLLTPRRAPQPAAAPPSDSDLPDACLKIEREQIVRHRTAVGVDPDIPATQVPGLAISGGGIRSAVFSLGVLQALADQGSLKQFSYLSTVSGGTYLGAFYGSLFIPDALRQGAPSAPAAASIASAKSAAERLRPKTPPPRPGSVTPIEYLRDNCNYLIPNGLDDALQSIVFSIRNWFALQYVIGVSILTLILWLNLVEMVPWWCPKNLSLTACQPDRGWVLPAIIAGVIATAGLSPLSRAYWLTQNLAQDMRRTFQALPWISLILVDVAAIGTIAVLDPRLWPFLRHWGSAPEKVATGAWLVIGTQLFALAYYFLAWIYVSGHSNSGKRFFPGSVPTTSRASDSRPFVDRLRNALTNAYTTPLRIGRREFFAGPAQMLMYVAAIALVDGMGAVVHNNATRIISFLNLPVAGEPGLMASWAGLGGAIWAASKFLLSNMDQVGSSLMRIPRMVLASVAAVAAALLTLGFWSTIAHFVVPSLNTYAASAPWWSWLKPWVSGWDSEFALACTCILFLLLSIVDGLCIQFLNLSTYQRLYSTRLTRAFLGASNRTRLDNANQRDVTSLVSGDSISMGQYYREKSYAPVHLINTTVNKTVDWNSSLVHRGARGLSLSLGPAGITIGARLGVLACQWKDADDISTPAHHLLGKRTTWDIWLESLTLGDWIAISGAAVSTGLGQMTRPGYSMLLGLANIRLGYWWNTYSPPFRDGAQRYTRARVPLPNAREPSHFFRETLFGTQFCLKSELLGAFDGPRARRWYLTDGGHFENTGAYELLRRQLEFILILDNGADPKLIFDDIANLIRLARVDFGIEITTSDEAPRQPKTLRINFDHVALSFHDFAKRPECIAVRLITTFANGAHGQILVIKPRLTTMASHDVWEYRQDMDSFPHESTADQFFNDVQWECHRALGESEAKCLFANSRRGSH